MLFLATTLNYLDRAVVGILKADLMRDLHWNEIDYSNIVFAFSAAYAVGYLVAGRAIDLLGVRRGYAIIVSLWSLAAAGHAWMRSVLGFSLMRAALGLAEGGNFPAAVKAVSEWFPRRERALATGIFNAGSNVGVIAAPLLVPWLTLNWGWPFAFLVTGLLGLLWVIPWLTLYRRPDRHPRVSRTELAYIQSDPPDPEIRIPWVALLKFRQTWVFVVGMFLSGPIWWFYLYWVPGFLYDRHGLDLSSVGPPLIAIYLMADVGSVAGGWISSRLIAGGWTVNAARKTAMLACALAVVPVFFASTTESVLLATVLIGLAAAAHQGFSANLYTLVSDTAPRFAVGSIVGIGGMAAAVGGMFNAKLVGYVLEWTGSYVPLFAIASSAYLINLAIMHWLNPRLDPIDLSEFLPGRGGGEGSDR
ncbi:MAG: MFS transporter [Acidobacteriota bacterium]